jgi:aminoglycoside phosphotransferase (APT) family kinase protein
MAGDRRAFDAALEKWTARRRRMFYPKTDIDFDLAEMRRRKQELANLDLSKLPSILNKEIRSIEFMHNAGTFHALFRIHTPDGRYILKVSPEKAAFELGIDSWANRNRTFRVAEMEVRPRRLPYPFLIMEEAKGQPLTTFENPETQALPEPLLFELGRTVARNHFLVGCRAGLLDLSTSERDVPEAHPFAAAVGLHETWRDYLLLRLDEHIQVCRDIDAINDAEVGAINKAFSTTPPAKVIRMLHGDLGHHNVFTDGQSITEIIDWEDALVGDPIFDIAYWGTFVRDEMRARFIEGYESHEKLQSDFEYRYWLYYLRIALSKTVHRHRFGTKDRPGRPPASQRIQKALSNLAKL